MGESAYTGDMGRTRTGETTVWCSGCGTWFGARWFRVIDAAADPDLLATLVDEGFAGINENDCPACERAYTIEEPIAVHRPDERELLLVVPPGRLHRAQQARAELIAAVADAPGERLPAYAREPALVAGVAGLRARVEASAAAPTVEAPAEPADPTADEALDPTRISTPPAARPAGAGLLAALLEDAPAAPADDEAGWDEPADWDRHTTWEEGWSLDAPPADEPTRVAQQPPRLRPGVDRALVLDDDVPTARVRVASAAAGEALLAEGGALRCQLHETAHGPACCLALLPAAGDPIAWALDDAELVDRLARRFAVAVEAIDPQGALVARRVYDPPLARNVALARERAQALGGETTAARAALVDGGVDLVGELRHNFREDTFARLRTAAEAQLALGITAFWADPERARYLLLVQSFPAVWFDAIVRRVLTASLEFGLLPPPHLERWAIEHGVVADAHRLLRQALAGFAELELGLAGRTSDLDPLDAWENWERLLTRAEALGVDVDPQIEALALRAMEAARRAAEDEEGSEELMELDPEDAIEVESVDLSMGDGSASGALDEGDETVGGDDDDYGRAAYARDDELGAGGDAAGAAADSGFADDEGSSSDDEGFADEGFADDSGFADDDLAEDSAFADDDLAADDLADHDPIARLAERGDAVLLGLLDDRTQRAAAAAVLLRRGEALYAPTLADALAAMEPAELLLALPEGLALAPVLAPHLRDALHDGGPAARRALALYLAEAGLGDAPDARAHGAASTAPFAVRLAAALDLDASGGARSKGDAASGFE